MDVGAVGYLPQIEYALKKDEWLHKIVNDLSSDSLGVDINSEGIEYCRRLGYDNIICANIEMNSERIMEGLGYKHIDYILFGEMLHEVDNPVGVLSNVRRGFKGHADRIIITVPSIYCVNNIIHALRGVDRNHTESRFWFSTYTLCRMVFAAGYIPKKIYLARKIKGRKLKIINRLYRKNIFSDHIVLVADLI